MAPRSTGTRGGRRIITVIDSFLSPKECQAILSELETTYWQSSAVVERRGRRAYTEVREDFRSSLTTQQEWFSPRLNKLVARIERRLADRLCCLPENLESWQATRYSVGEYFDYHVDCGLGNRQPGGERARTVVLYVDTPARGGETHFRALDRTIEARAGRLIAWPNLLPSGHCDYAMVHSGLPVRRGAKTTLVTWEHVRQLHKGERK
jgi:prolyl 4-hydroxylase